MAKEEDGEVHEEVPEALDPTRPPVAKIEAMKLLRSAKGIH